MVLLKEKGTFGAPSHFYANISAFLMPSSDQKGLRRGGCGENAARKRSRYRTYFADNPRRKLSWNEEGRKQTGPSGDSIFNISNVQQRLSSALGGSVRINAHGQVWIMDDGCGIFPESFIAPICLVSPETVDAKSEQGNAAHTT
jgi:hypothetical protein